MTTAYDSKTKEDVHLDTPADDVISVVGNALAYLLLKNKAKLSVTVARQALGKAQKQTLRNFLIEFVLDHFVSPPGS